MNDYFCSDDLALLRHKYTDNIKLKIVKTHERMECRFMIGCDANYPF